MKKIGNNKAKQTEISVLYNLPENWSEETAFSFDHLSDLVLQLHDSAYSATVKAVNRFATIRNYVIGFYIVEYEQHGNDRAKYGDRLLKRLAERVNKRGINQTLLTNSRKFYLSYPQIKNYLTGQIGATPSHQSAISPTASDKSVEKSPTASDKFITAAEKLISSLSFSHIVELLTVDDPLARFFYETECIRCCWSVKELRRQISTNLFFRAGVSKRPELLLERTETNTSPALTIRDPFSFEFLDLRPEAFTENDFSCRYTALHPQRRQDGGVCFGWHGQQPVCLYLHAFAARQKDITRFSVKRDWKMKKGWEYKTIKECCEILDSRRKPITKSKREAGNIPYYGATGLLDYVKDYIFDEPLVLLGEDGAKWGAGELSAYRIEGKSWVNNHAHALRPKRETITDYWLIYFLNYSNLQSYITGVTVPKLNQEKMSSITIPVPPLTEQQSIVSYLDAAFAKIDAMKANAEKALSEAKALFQASLKDLLTPKKGWEEKTLKEIVHSDCTLSYGIVQPGEHAEDGVPVVRPVDFNDKVFVRAEGLKRTKREISEAYKRTILKGGEILLCVRGTTGTMGLASDELVGCNVTRGIVPIFFDKDVNTMFVYYQLLSPKLQIEIQKKTTGAALKQINIKDLRVLHLMFPSLSEQQSIVSTLDSLKSKVDRLQANYEKISAECDALKQAILRQVFE